MIAFLLQKLYIPTGKNLENRNIKRKQIKITYKFTILKYISFLFSSYAYIYF